MCANITVAYYTKVLHNTVVYSDTEGDEYYSPNNVYNLYMLALSTVYSDHTWYPWRFQKHPPNLWHSLETQRKFFDWLAQQLNFVHPDDWYKVKASDINWSGGSNLLNAKYNGSIFRVITTTTFCTCNSYSLWNNP